MGWTINESEQHQRQGLMNTIISTPSQYTQVRPTLPRPQLSFTGRGNSHQRYQPRGEVQTANSIQIIGTVFSRPGMHGDFLAMLKSDSFDDALFIYNDNEESRYTCIRGGGNASIRPYNKFNKYNNTK